MKHLFTILWIVFVLIAGIDYLLTKSNMKQKRAFKITIRIAQYVLIITLLIINFLS